MSQPSNLFGHTVAKRVAHLIQWELDARRAAVDYQDGWFFTHLATANPAEARFVQADS